MGKDGIDIGLEDEIICLIQELHEVESHSYKSYLVNKDKKWLDLLNKARELRTKWMEKIFVEEDGTQKWCATKHILSASKRATEVGTKYLSMGKDKECEEAFKDSGEILGMYYFMNEESKPEKTNLFIEIVDKLKK